MLAGRAGMSCRLSRVSGVQVSIITPLQGEGRRTSRKFFPGAVCFVRALICCNVKRESQPHQDL